MVRDKRYYFIQEHMPEEVFHGSIGNMDIEKVLLANGVTPLRFPFHHSFSFWAKWGRLGFLVIAFFLLPRDAVVFFQHPMYAGMNKILVKLLGYRKSITIVCIIADINGLKHGDEAVLQKEIRQFRTYRYFIVHNLAMQQWLQSQVPHQRSAMIRFFDFLTAPDTEQRTNSRSIAFAGNLEKSGFLDNMEAVARHCPSLTFNVYGPHVTTRMKACSNVKYKGVRDPYDLPQVLQGSFGLIWDGEGVEQPEGSMGHYMQYITHHKTSLYILSGMPIIVYENAGAAALVSQYKIGITIRSLFEIEEKLQALSDTEYRQMVHNMHDLATQIASGACLGQALQEIKLIIQRDQK
ncbi:hypothetical protein D3H65_10835 [Paraflavitalea soli]|uniref:Beta-1,6-galactofuranosyltransferase n=1 Tax=Paraflavitalea soli TaxID=2315862 RepID=A0A3B7MVJ0_9BACT|nr:hypothetical protein [Paraflavitalea soli]AXY74441.1 hypothetical protein D3H65_10835 [Paraflavitalea soli]